jgi:hypothetical protein
MTEEDAKWIETNNVVCALLRQAHDALALSSLPMRRKWVGLTVEEMNEITWGKTVYEILELAEAKLKEKNT